MDVPSDHPLLPHQVESQKHRNTLLYCRSWTSWAPAHLEEAAAILIYLNISRQQEHQLARHQLGRQMVPMETVDVQHFDDDLRDRREVRNLEQDRSWYPSRD